MRGREGERRGREKGEEGAGGGRRGGGRREKRGREEGEGRKKGREEKRGNFARAKRAPLQKGGGRQGGGRGRQGAGGGRGHHLFNVKHWCKAGQHRVPLYVCQINPKSVILHL